MKKKLNLAIGKKAMMVGLSNGLFDQFKELDFINAFTVKGSYCKNCRAGRRCPKHPKGIKQKKGGELLRLGTRLMLSSMLQSGGSPQSKVTVAPERSPS